MKINKLFLNLLFLTIILVVIELTSATIIYLKENKVSFLFKPFSKISKNFKQKQEVFLVNWDKNKDRIVPGNYSHEKYGKKINYKINSKGFRGSEFSFKKKVKNRIIAFGGSTTIGLGSEINQTYPKNLEDKLKKKDFDVEVLNFGLPAKSLNFIRELYFKEAFKYKPDIIIIYSNRNPTMYDSIGTKIMIDERLDNDKIIRINLILMDNVMTFRLLYKAYRKIINLTIKSDKIISPYKDDIKHNVFYFTDQYYETLNEIINFSKKNSTKVVLVKQAFFFNPPIQKKLRSYDLKESIEVLKNLKKDNIDQLNYHDSFWSVTNVVLNKTMDKFKNHQNVIIVDPIESLLNSEENFTDFVHLSPRGNTILADKISNKIKSILNK